MISIEPMLDTDEDMPAHWDTSDYRADCVWGVWYQHNTHSSPVLRFTGIKADAIRFYDWFIEQWS